MSKKSPFNHLSTGPDGRLIGVTQLISGWDGSLFISDDCKKVIKKTLVSIPLLKAHHILKRHGFDDDNVHIVNLQAQMDASEKECRENNKAPDGTKPREMHHEEVLWDLPFEVKPQFCDEHGKETNDIYVETDDSTGVEWACVFMVGVHAKEVTPSAPRIARNRKGRPKPTGPTGGKDDDKKDDMDTDDPDL